MTREEANFEQSSYIYSSVDGEPLGIESNESIGSVVGTSSDGARAWKIGRENGANVFGIGGKGSAQVESAFNFVDK